jgi:predicted MFS family arabinose efflux permease
MLAGAVGFAVAGAILALYKSPTILFFADASTFAIAALIVLGIRTLGGGASAAPVSGALKRTWSIAAARPHLVVGTMAAFLLAFSFPALVALAYQIAVNEFAKPQPSGGQVYSMLEVVLSVGVFAGAIFVGRLRAIGSMRTVGAGLLLTGIFSVAVAFSSYSLIVVAVALFVASFGNPVYAVANQTALLEAADASNRGTVMATRFGLVQTASIAGAAAGGLLTSAFGPLAAYGALGVGVVLLAMYALAAGRSTTNPLHGAPYEEAQLLAAASHPQNNDVAAVPEEEPGGVRAR